MNNCELEKAIRQDPVTSEVFLGVYPRDKIPNPTSETNCLIVNTANEGTQGQHWVAMYKDGRKYEFFDSYGRKAFANKFIGNNLYTYNSTLIQSPISAVCGEYCLYYLHYRTRGYSIDEIVDNLLSHTDTPDVVVKDFAEQNFDLDTLRGNMYCLPRT